MKITALIGKRIKILRLERGLTQGDIEETTGVSRSHISKIESGKVANPGLDTLEKIQDAYLSATRGELKGLAESFLNPSKVQIFVVGDKTTTVRTDKGDAVTLEEALKRLSSDLRLPFREIPLR